MNTSLSRELHRLADAEPISSIKRDRLRAAAIRASYMEHELDLATRVATTREMLRLHLVRSLEMLGPKDTA